MKLHEFQYPQVTELERNGNKIMERNTVRLESSPDVVLRLHHMSLESLESIRTNLGDLATRVAYDIATIDQAIQPLLPVEPTETPPAV